MGSSISIPFPSTKIIKKKSNKIFLNNNILEYEKEKSINNLSNIKNSASQEQFPVNDIIVDDKIVQDSSKINLQHFNILKMIGRGSFGKVMLVKHIQDNKYYALKSIKKEKILRTNHKDHTKSERRYKIIRILEILDHPFIVRLRFAFQTVKNLYLV